MFHPIFIRGEKHSPLPLPTPYFRGPQKISRFCEGNHVFRGSNFCQNQCLAPNFTTFELLCKIKHLPQLREHHHRTDRTPPPTISSLFHAKLSLAPFFECLCIMQKITKPSLFRSKPKVKRSKNNLPPCPTPPNNPTPLSNRQKRCTPPIPPKTTKPLKPWNSLTTLAREGISTMWKKPDP